MLISHRRTALLSIIVLLAAALAAPTLAQSDVRTFTETNHTLRGAFRVFWEANGGVPIFGYPITEEYRVDDQITQYFERARFTLVSLPDGWTVELGRLGAEVTTNRIFPKVPPISNTPNRRFIAETQHIIQYGFKEVWEQHGEARIFGFPLSEEIDEVLDDGAWHTVQYFENARFEYWPDREPGQRVLISNLGRRLAPTILPASPVPNQPTTPAMSPTAVVYPTAAPTTMPTTVPTATPLPRASTCDPSYPTVCIPPPPPDLDCTDVSFRNFKVLPPDPHHFDGDHDGVGCES